MNSKWQIVKYCYRKTNVCVCVNILDIVCFNIEILNIKCFVRVKLTKCSHAHGNKSKAKLVLNTNQCILFLHTFDFNYFIITNYCYYVVIIQNNMSYSNRNFTFNRGGYAYKWSSA